MSADYFEVAVNVPVDVSLGDTLLTKFYTTPDMPDVNLEDNIAVVEAKVISSYDPNDKRVFLAEGPTVAEIRGR